MIVIACVTMMVPLSCRWVIVRGRPVVVIRVIVLDVLVDMQRRRHGRRHDQGLNKREYYEPAHGSSGTTTCWAPQKGETSRRVG